VSSDSILVVDDDAAIRRMLARTLEAEGYAVESAGDGGAALAASGPGARAQPARGGLARAAAAERGQVVTRELAVDRVWGGRGAVGSNSVDRYVSYLRAKLGEPGLIDTARGVGFVLR
jgi:two-component system response regulator MprA